MCHGEARRVLLAINSSHLLTWNPYFMGIFSPLRNWVDEFIPYYMEIMGVDRPDRTNGEML